MRPTSPFASTSAARLRFAPSPTGYLHIGGLRTALYNHLLARKWGGKWILRIEDTDQERKVDGAVDSLRRNLEWAGLEYDEGPGTVQTGRWSYVQSERVDLYRFHVQQLLDSGMAYRCFCTPDELHQIRLDLKASGSPDNYDRRGLYLTEEEVARRLRGGEKHVVRFKSSPNPVSHTDLVYGGTEAHPTVALDDMILLKSDGFPTYHLANVVDDHEMGITHVLRGEEWLPSVNKHLQLYQAFGWNKPQFAHLPLLVNADGSKLSKRHNAVAVEDYVRAGYEPQALNNFVALLGWNTHPTREAITQRHDEAHSHFSTPLLEAAQDEDCLTMEELIQRFDIAHIANHHAQVSREKLDHLQKLHVNRKWESGLAGKQELISKVRQVLEQTYPDSASSRDEALIGRMIETERIRLNFVQDIAKNVFVFQEPNLSSPDAVALLRKIDASLYLPTLRLAHELFSALSPKAFETIEPIIGVLNSLGSPAGDKPVNRAKRMMPLRHALTGTKMGPAVGQVILFVGRDKVLARLESAITRAESEVLEGCDA